MVTIGGQPSETRYNSDPRRDLDCKMNKDELENKQIWKHEVGLLNVWLHYIKSLLSIQGGRHFARGTVSPEMFVWLPLISHN